MARRTPGSGKGRLVAGLILIGLGAYFLLDEFDIIPYWVDLGRLWPLAIIVLGLLLITRTSRKAVAEEAPAAPAEPGTTTTTTTSTTTTTTNDNPEQPLT